MTFESSYTISTENRKIIPESGVNFMKKLLPLVLMLTLVACQSESRSRQDPLKFIELVTPTGESIETTLAFLSKDQEQGLSGVRPEDFRDNQGMLFFYLGDDEKNFWMPDTYFDLDLFYLDKDLRIIDIVRKLPHYVGRANPQLIPRARGIWCRHTLEMKSSSQVAEKLKVGDVLKWKSKLSLNETESKVKTLLQK
jgi:uncharacterized membrane protein (UPF0127 family)